MPRTPDAPLRRVTLNLFEADCRWLEQEYGPGWTTRIRQHLHNEIQLRIRHKGFQNSIRRTLGDLPE